MKAQHIYRWMDADTRKALAVRFIEVNNNKHLTLWERFEWATDLVYARYPTALTTKTARGVTSLLCKELRLIYAE